MKALMRLVTCIICMAMLFSLTMPALAVEERAAVRQCPNCSTGTATQHTTRVYQHDETFNCSHGGSGKDTYAVYEVTIIESCNSCSYRYSYSYEDHVLKYCPAN